MVVILTRFAATMSRIAIPRSDAAARRALFGYAAGHDRRVELGRLVYCPLGRLEGADD